MSWLVGFYRGTEPDYLGRWLQEIWTWDHERLEMVHNYIQVLFPNAEPSMFNTRAPLLDEETITAFHQDPEMRANLRRSLDVMLNFYGLERNPVSGVIGPGPTFALRSSGWLAPGDHNFLRLTRILKCLMTLGLPEEARALFTCLQELYARFGSEIGAETFAYWQNAVNPVS